MDVSIIIVNYNTKKLTSECIKSIVEKTKGVDYEIILVDNASTDGSKEVFQKDDRITYIYNEINGGFGYGNNRGMEVAKGKYFFSIQTLILRTMPSKNSSITLKIILPILFMDVI